MNKSVKKGTGHYAHPHRKYIGNNLKITNINRYTFGKNRYTYIESITFLHYECYILKRKPLHFWRKPLHFKQKALHLNVTLYILKYLL